MQSKPASETPSDSSRSIHLLQLTDLHLFADPAGQLYGRSTRASLEQVIARLRERHWPADAMLLTGDLVHDESQRGYRDLRRLIDQLGLPCYCIPGNHDHIGHLAAEVDPGAGQPFRAIHIGRWDLLLLDSTIPGSACGRLHPESLAAIERHLAGPGELSSQHDAATERTPAATTGQRPTLICMHHQPVPVGSTWIDTMLIENSDVLLRIVAQHPQVRALLWGHVHQAFDDTIGTIRLLATPSTCSQFAPKQEKFALDERPPGYRWLRLYPDGRLETGVERVSDIPFAPSS